MKNLHFRGLVEKPVLQAARAMAQSVKLLDVQAREPTQVLCPKLMFKELVRGSDSKTNKTVPEE